MVEGSRDPVGPAPLQPDGETLSHKVASEAAALVAEQVRHAMAAAERSAEELRQRARDQALADREATHDTAGQVLARIDQIEVKLGQLLRDLRTEAMQIAEEADPAREPRPPDSAPAADLPPSAEPIPGAVSEAEPMAGRVVQPPDEAISPAGRSFEQSDEVGHPAGPAVGQADDARPAPETASPAEPVGGQAEQPADDARHAAGPVAGQADEAWPDPEPVSAPEPVGDHAEEPAGMGSAGRPAVEEAGSDAPLAAGEADEAKPLDWPSSSDDAQTSSADEEAPPGIHAGRRRGGLFRQRRDA